MPNQAAISTNAAAAALGPYSQAVVTATAIYCLGSIPLAAEGQLVEGTVGKKTAQVCKNLSKVLEAANSSLQRVVNTTVFLADIGLFNEMNEEYEMWFSHKPARSCVAVKTLPKNVDIEIECIELPSSRGRLESL